MRRAARVCPTQGCANLIGGSDKLCPPCLATARSIADSKRLSSTKRGYDAEWRKIRANHLANYPMCVECGAQASEVDHHIPLEAGGTSDDDNLRSHCKTCHSRKTAKYDGGFGNPRVGKGVKIAKKTSFPDRAGS